MQTDALIRNFGEPAPEGYDGRFLRESDDRRAYVSREVGTLAVLSQQPSVLLAGSLRGDRFFFDIEYLLDAEETRIEGLALQFDLEATTLESGERLELPPVLLVAGGDAIALLERYATEVAEELSARVPDHVPTGWCSWYYVYTKVSDTPLNYMTPGTNSDSNIRVRFHAIAETYAAAKGVAAAIRAAIDAWRDLTTTTKMQSGLPIGEYDAKEYQTEGKEQAMHVVSLDYSIWISA